MLTGTAQSTGRRGTFWSVGSRSDSSYQLDDVAKHGALDLDRVIPKQGDVAQPDALDQDRTALVEQGERWRR